MDAKQKIEAALAAGPTETEWRPLVTRIDDARGYQICHFDLHGKSEKERDANRALVVACQPANIRELLQTLASNAAEVERLKAELSNIAFARRYDREYFSDDTAFADWAISRAGHALTNQQPE